MSTKTAKLTRSEAQRLLGKARKLERDADDYRTAGLDERAAKLEGEVAQLRETAKAWSREKRQKDREQRRRNREAQERHEKAQKEHEAETARRAAARVWYRSWIRYRGGRPQPASQVLPMAEQAGHDPEDLEAAVVRVKRRKDGVECLGFKGEYLRGEFLSLEQRSARVKA